MSHCVFRIFLDRPPLPYIILLWLKPTQEQTPFPFGRVKFYNATKSSSQFYVFFRYNSTLENLSTLELVGSYMEIRNYIAMITGILSRLYMESRNTSSCGQWSQIQDVLISSACKVPYTDQVMALNRARSVFMNLEISGTSQQLGLQQGLLLTKSKQGRKPSTQAAGLL